MKLTHKQLEENLYIVKDKDDEKIAYATFRLIDARHASPPSCKHMEVSIYDGVISDIEKTLD